MKTLVVALATALLAVATPAGAAEEAVGTTGSPEMSKTVFPSVVDNWRGSYDNNDGYRIGTAVYITRQSGAELEGELELTQRNCGGRFPLKGTLEGNVVSFKTLLTPNNRHCGERTMIGSFEGNTLNGNFGTGHRFELRR